MFMRFIITGIIAGKGNNKGFSLMGVVVSIIVISIMAVMSMPALKGALFEDRANNVSILANTLINAESTYVNNNRKFGDILPLQEADYLPQGLGINLIKGKSYPNCIYGTIESKNDTKICLSVNNGIVSGTLREISYALTISVAENHVSGNYYNYYREVSDNIPGSSIINGKEIIYIDPIAISNYGGAYDSYIGKNFYITGATCYITRYYRIKEKFGYHKYERVVSDGPLKLYFIVEAVKGNEAILSYADDSVFHCIDKNIPIYKYGEGDSYTSVTRINGAFQNSYLPEVRGMVEYESWNRISDIVTDYVPIRPSGYEIEIPADHLPKLINLNQTNTEN
ncbi:hypothetical protein ACMCNP_05910 [Candidatus Acidulodesulfobacterium sp. H_13]|uniref:hypothetical protein n=1 Tax=Candidatus Acidulodesulfobacterium sp. H_13 TaxID=3395470 RepID=UPI003AF7B6E8